MTPNSFSFGRYNSVDQWGMRVLEADVLLPEKRPRKITIPGRSGTYDFGASCYEERLLRLSCDLLSQQPFSRAQLREIALALSGKKALRLASEPDKYYTAELYHAPNFSALAAGHVYTIDLEFVCQPFAYGDAITIPVSSGRTLLSYPGTAPAPFILTLRNTSSSSFHGVTISLLHRKS